MKLEQRKKGFTGYSGLENMASSMDMISVARAELVRALEKGRGLCGDFKAQYVVSVQEGPCLEGMVSTGGLHDVSQAPV